MVMKRDSTELITKSTRHHKGRWTLRKWRFDEDDRPNMVSFLPFLWTYHKVMIVAPLNLQILLRESIKWKHQMCFDTIGKQVLLY